MAQMAGLVLPPAEIGPQTSANIRDIRSCEQLEPHARRLPAFPALFLNCL
jgi:hypothetical protein